MSKKRVREPDTNQASLSKYFSPVSKKQKLDSGASKKRVEEEEEERKSDPEENGGEELVDEEDEPAPKAAAATKKRSKTQTSPKYDLSRMAYQKPAAATPKKVTAAPAPKKATAAKKKAKPSTKKKQVDDEEEDDDPFENSDGGSDHSDDDGDAVMAIDDSEEEGNSSKGKLPKKSTNSKKELSSSFKDRLKNLKRDEKKHAKFVATLGPKPGWKDDEKPENSQKEDLSLYQKPNAKYTQMEKQFLEIRDKYPGIVLFVEHGYRYKFFGKDAEIASKVLKVQSFFQKNFLSAVVPVHRFHIHARRLVQAGYKVGVVSQTETAALKAASATKSKLFGRALTALYTKSTFVGQEIDPLVETSKKKSTSSAKDDEGDEGYITGMDDDLAGITVDLVKSPGFVMGNYLMCIAEEQVDRKQVKIAIAAVQTSTGDIIYDYFEDGFLRKELETRLSHINPIEILLPEPVSDQTEKLIRNFNPRKEQEDLVSIVTYDPKELPLNVSLTFLDEIFAPRTKETKAKTPKAPKKKAAKKKKAPKKKPQKKKATTKGKRRDDDDDEDEEEEEEDENEDDEEGDDGDGEGFIPDDEEIIQGKQKAKQLVRSWHPLLITCFANLVQFTKRHSLESLFFLDCNYQTFESKKFMNLDGTTLKNLEIFQAEANLFGKGTLFWVMNHTRTAMGRRMLIDWLRRPLFQTEEIKSRLDAVEELIQVAKVPPVSEFLDTLSQLPDLERGICRIYYKKCSTKEFVAVLEAFKSMAQSVPGPLAVSSPHLKKLLSNLPLIQPELSYFYESMRLDQIKDGEVPEPAELFEDNVFPDMTACKMDIKKHEDDLNEHLNTIRKILADKQQKYIKKLKDEYVIEVKLQNLGRVPNEWKSVSGTKTCKRYQTPFVLKHLALLNQARERLTIESKIAWSRFLDTFAGKYPQFRVTVGTLAELDCLHSLSILAQHEGYVKPVISDETYQIKITEGRHPIIQTLSDQVVPNNVSLTTEVVEVPSSTGDTKTETVEHKCMILTGPNMGGKTSYTKMVALICIMAQIGSFVPADYACITPLDSIRTRMGAHDDMTRGESTFLVELLDTARLLHLATPRSLVILDELGRGTSTHDGVAIAFGTLQYLVENLRPFTLFVTHFPALKQLEEKFPHQISYHHMGFLPDTSDSTSITFLYKLSDGVEGRSYGLNVAKLANLKPALVERAEHFSHLLEEGVIERQFQYMLKVLLGLGAKGDEPAKFDRNELKSHQNNIQFLLKQWAKMQEHHAGATSE